MHRLLDRAHERVRQRPQLHLQPELHSPARRVTRPARLDAQADGRDERVGVLAEHLQGRARAGGPFDADGGGLAEGDLQAEVVQERGLDDLLLHLAVERDRHLLAQVVLAQADQRVLLGEPAQREVQRGPVGGATGRHDGLQRGRREVPCGGSPGAGARVRRVLVLRAGQPVADADVGQAPEAGDPAGGHVLAAHGRAAVEDADRSDPALTSVVEVEPVAGVQGAAEDAGVGDLLPCGTPFDLENGARDRIVRVVLGGWQQLPDARHQRLHACPHDGRAEEHRVDQRPAGLVGEFGAQAGGGDRALVVHVRRQQRVLLRGEHVHQVLGERGLAVERRERGGTRTEAGDRAHGDDGRGQLGGELAQDAVVTGATAVDLVDEDERGDAEAAQRAHEHAGLRLHALHGGHHQDGAVQHAQHPLHLGDEVGMARRVDQVDRGVADGEGHDRRLDGDAAPAFQGKGVGLGVAVIDAADLVDDPGGVQQPLGQAGLTGVYMRQDSQVEHTQRTSCPLIGRLLLSCGTWTPGASGLLRVVRPRQ